MALVGCGGLGALGTAEGSSAGTSILGSILGAATNGDALGNILTSVLGADKPSETQIVSTWKYVQPGVAFTSDNLLAKAGGEVAASQIKEKLSSYYSQLGVKSSNTYFTFGSNKQFEGKLLGTSLSGTYTYDASSGAINMKTALLGININGYITGNTNGIGLLFEGKKLLSLLQTVASLSGNSTLSTIGDLSTNYDGLRLGFEMSR